MSDIRTWIPESDILKPGEPCSVQEFRSWFERLPRMRALIRQQQEHIESLRSEPFPKKWTRKMRKKQNEANRSE